MPGWHEATKELQKQGKVQMVGIIQEQHPDRARLFMQWKQMGWPILVDSLNLLEVPYVPITLAIDENGIIRIVNPPRSKAGEIESAFLNQNYEKPAKAIATKASRPDLNKLRAATKRGTAEAWRDYATALIRWGGPARLDEAITAYNNALKVDPNHGYTHFRQGVAYRMRYDSDKRQAEDFQKAIEHWTRALNIDPNNYIWRRRIQQYGPRLDKPYPFYDWVPTARKEIIARGETPLPLTVEPGGAEIARPSRSFEGSNDSKENPDPEGKILRDERNFINVETTAVPATVSPGKATRVHLVFRPNHRIKAHWNNEVDNLVIHVEPPDGWAVDSRHHTMPNPPQTVSQEIRKIEFELRCPENAQPGTVTIPGYALYYVCEDVNGTCLYRRQDIALKVEVKKSVP